MRPDSATAEDASTPAESAGPDGPSNPPAVKPKKSTNAVVAQRVEEILRIRIDGASFGNIRDYANQPERAWGLSDSQLKRLIQKSDDLLKERTERSRGRATRLHLSRRESLYARALQAADFRTALAALDSDAKLRGLYDEPGKLRQQALDLLTRIAQLEDAARAGSTPDPEPLERPDVAPPGRPATPDAGDEQPQVPSS